MLRAITSLSFLLVLSGCSPDVNTAVRLDSSNPLEVSFALKGYAGPRWNFEPEAGPLVGASSNKIAVVLKNKGEEVSVRFGPNWRDLKKGESVKIFSGEYDEWIENLDNYYLGIEGNSAVRCVLTISSDNDLTRVKKQEYRTRNAVSL